MDASQGYAVFFFEQALEVLGDAIKPYLVEGPGGIHVLCTEIDTGGALVEMAMAARTIDDRVVEMELMVPTSMVRMIVSARSDGAFGFGLRDARTTTLPPIFPMPGSGTPVEAAPRQPPAADGATPVGGAANPALAEPAPVQPEAAATSAIDAAGPAPSK